MIPAGWSTSEPTAILTPHSVSSYSSVTTAPGHFSLHSQQQLHGGACVPLHCHPDTTKIFSEDRGQVSAGAMTMILGTSSFLNWVKGLASPLHLDGDWNRSMGEEMNHQEWHCTAEVQGLNQVPSLFLWGKPFCGVCPGPKCSSM